MALIKSKHSILTPQTDLLTYLFDSPYQVEAAWPDSEPLLISAAQEKPTCYTLAEIKPLVKRIGHGLHTLGARGKRVMIYGTANIHFPIAVLGAIAAGAAVNVLASGAVEELVFRLRQLECDVVLFAPGDVGTVIAAADEIGIVRERLFVVDDGLTQDGEGYGRGARHWSFLLDMPDGDTYEWPRLSSPEAKSTTAMLLYTSGTTETPKLAARSHYSLIGNIEQTLHHYTLRPRNREGIFCNYRFAGMGFLLVGVLIPLKARYKTIFPVDSSVNCFVKTVERLKPSWIMAPRQLMRETLALPVRPDLRSVKHVLTGGAIIPWELVREWQGAFGGQVQSTYGMTEAGFFTMPDPNEIVEDATTGILLPNIEAKIIEDDGHALSRNKKGNVYIKTPFAMSGYLSEPAQTAETITEDGWIRTGDIGWVDYEDKFYIVCRKKDLYINNDEEVTAAQIETAILQHPGVRDVAVIPITLPESRASCPRGYIVKNKGSILIMDELKDWIQQRLPSRLHLTGGAAFIDAIPISNIGNSKVDRRKLLEIAEKELNIGERA